MKIQFLQMGQGVAQKRSVTFLKVTHQLPAEIKELKQPVSGIRQFPSSLVFPFPDTNLPAGDSAPDYGSLNENGPHSSEGEALLGVGALLEKLSR